MIKESSGNRVKVFFVIPCLCRGGAERIMSIILARLDRSRIEPVCIFYKSQHVYHVPEDVKVFCLEIPGTPSMIRKVYYSIMRIFRIAGLIKTEKPDVVFSCLPMVNIVMVLSRALASLICGKRVVLYIYEVTTLSAHLLTLNKYLGRISHFMIKMFYPRADKVIVNAEGVKRDLVKNFNVSEEKTQVFYSLMDIDGIVQLSHEELYEHSWFNEDIPIIINIGALRVAKAQHHLLQAFKLIREKVNCRLVIIGEGVEEEPLRKLSAELGISDDVAILGFQDNIFKFMRRSSVFVLSSVYEGFPTILIEAMACGVPVVSTRCPSGPEEVISDSVNGLLVPVGDVSAIAEAVLKVINDKDLAASMVEEASKIMMRYDAGKAIVAYEDLFYHGSIPGREALNV